MRRAAGSVWCKLLVWLLVVILTMTCAIYTFLELLCWDIAGPSREELSTPAAMTQVLEQLSCQSQLLVDLLGAVNSLTAALLAQSGRG